MSIMRGYRNCLLACAFAAMGGCYATDGCLLMPQAVYCPLNEKSDFDRYRKVGVDDGQKTLDFKDCGGTPDRQGYIFGELRAKINSRDSYEYFDAQKKFYDCMIVKGYQYDSAYLKTSVPD